uniref:Uncharacterized protein n=1 Tax=Rhizophora mucronata TaxID=61149 RepID=A0A2P2QGB6_RHIMU
MFSQFFDLPLLLIQDYWLLFQENFIQFYCSRVVF